MPQVIKNKLSYIIVIVFLLSSTSVPIFSASTSEHASSTPNDSTSTHDHSLENPGPKIFVHPDHSSCRHVHVTTTHSTRPTTHEDFTNESPHDIATHREDECDDSNSTSTAPVIPPTPTATTTPSEAVTITTATTTPSAGTSTIPQGSGISNGGTIIPSNGPVFGSGGGGGTNTNFPENPGVVLGASTENFGTGGGDGEFNDSFGNAPGLPNTGVGGSRISTLHILVTLFIVTALDMVRLRKSSISHFRK